MTSFGPLLSFQAFSLHHYKIWPLKKRYKGDCPPLQDRWKVQPEDGCNEGKAFGILQLFPLRYNIFRPMIVDKFCYFHCILVAKPQRCNEPLNWASGGIQYTL